MTLLAVEDPPNPIAFYRSLLAVDPAQTAIIAALAGALLESGDPSAALDAAAAAGEADDSVLTLIRARALKALCRFEPAAEAFAAVATHGPAGPELLTSLGVCLAEAGRLEEAVLWFGRVTETDPSAATLANLGAVQARLGREAEAAAACRTALHHDPALIDAHRTLAVLLADSDPEQAARHRDAAFGRQQIFVHDGPPGAPCILVLTCIAAASLPIRHLLPKSRYRIVEWFIDQADRFNPASPPHDFVFNAIGEADLMPPVADAVHRVLEAGRVVLNPPAAIMLTSRANLPDLLAGIEGIVVPPVARGNAALPLSEIALPALIRPVGSHGG